MRSVKPAGFSAESALRVDGMRRQMEKTAIELLKEAKEKIIELGDFFALKTDRSPQDAARLIREITAYLSSPPSERAKELVKDIRRTDADEAWHLTFNDAAHEIEAFGLPLAKLTEAGIK